MKNRLVIIVVMLLVLCFPPLARADRPVVCASGSGSVLNTDYDLTTCGAPANRPVYVVLRVKSDDTTPANAQMSEGSLSCDVNAPLDGYADCFVTVQDGVLDSFETTDAENYTLTASWIEPTPTAFPVFTHTIAPGVIMTLKREFTYGDIPNTLLVLFIVLVMVSLSLWYAMRKGQRKS